MIWIVVTIIVLLLIIIIVVLKRSKISTAKKTEKDLDGFKSYAFLPESTIHWPSLEKESETDVSKIVVDTVNKNMQEIGYELDLVNPELLVVLKTSTVAAAPPVYASFPYSATLPVHPVYLAYSYKGYQNYSEILGYSDTSTVNNRRWLKIDVVERETKKVLWTASSNDSVYVKKTSEEIVEYLNEMFKAYPVAKKKL